MILEDSHMKDSSLPDSTVDGANSREEIPSIQGVSLLDARAHLKDLQPQDRLDWAYQKFGNRFAMTTSFGIQSSVLLHMLTKSSFCSEVPVIWVDTGYLPFETYRYAEQLTNQFGLNIRIAQSHLTPANMEALHGRLWETKSVKDLERYHSIRKVEPLERAFNDLNVLCWASGVRGGQTDHRRSMQLLDSLRERFTLRPLLEWSQKEVFYYMEDNNLPQHPLFEKGYSTVGDWHSSSPDSEDLKGRGTRFGGLKQECGIHLPSESNREGI